MPPFSMRSHNSKVNLLIVINNKPPFILLVIWEENIIKAEVGCFQYYYVHYLHIASKEQAPLQRNGGPTSWVTDSFKKELNCYSTIFPYTELNLIKC